ncbi:MAG: phosphate acyltransferase PlsX [Dehalococcoidales bacterium]|jgi:glycerol-3-phosphate acyltransferase PlsX
MIIAVDAAGGDYAPQEVVKGAIKAAHEYKVEIALVGKKPILHVLAGRNATKSGITFVDASQVINFGEHPMKAVQSKPDSSIVVGINLLRDGAAQAFVSAGNTGAVVCAALLSLGKTDGVARPALGGITDLSGSAPVIIVDVGANVECRPSFLVEFAQLGSDYIRQVLGIESPKVGLLNIGEEESKGTKLVQESYKLLKESGLNFIGNVEGQDIVRRKADVIVTDGFTGNVVLKTMEGLSDMFVHSLNSIGRIFSTLYLRQGRALLNDIGLNSQIKRVDYREYGGACLLGVNGNVIIAHGRSQARAIKNAIGLAKLTAERVKTTNVKTANIKEEIHG